MRLRVVRFEVEDPPLGTVKLRIIYTGSLLFFQ